MKTITQNLLSCVRNRAIRLYALVTLFGFQVQASTQHSSSKFTTETNRVWINVTDTQGAFCQTLMGYRTGATDGYDHALDGAFMNDGAVALASLIGNVRYAIQFKGLPFTTSDVVPLSFKASYNGTYTFAIDHMDGFFTNTTFAVYLHDLTTNTYTNLKAGGYTFTSDSGMYNNRFELTYATASSNLGTNSNVFRPADLNVSQNSNNIVINAGTTILKDITLYTLNGQQLYQNNQIDASMATIINPVRNTQPIIIKVTTQEGVSVSKKWLCL